MRTSHRFVGTALSLMMTVGMVAPIATHATSVAAAPEKDYGSYSIEQLEALITKLQRQLAEMKQGSKCFVSERAISLGDGELGDGYDVDVRRLQSFLKEKGYFNRAATGYFGKVTRGSLEAFQRANGLPVTGEFDSATRGKAHAQMCRTVIKSTVKTEKKVEEKKKEEVKKIGVVNSLFLETEGGKVYWKTDGYSAQGFKVVWSRNTGPTYPNREGDTYNYLSDPSAAKSELSAFNGSGTYYVRVCEYLGGTCGKYSNEVSIQL